MQGTPLSYALRHYPQHFDHSYCQLVVAGEHSGLLASMLQRIASQYKARQLLRSQLHKALIYPVLVLFVGISVFLLLLMWVVPQIATVFMQFNQPLPVLTQIILFLTSGLQQVGGYIMVFSLICGIGGYVAGHYLPCCNHYLARWRWNFPAVGTLLQFSGCVLLARTLATLLIAGIPLSAGLPISLPVLKNSYAKQRLLSAADLINQGHSFSFALRQTQLFPHLALQMWQIGEHSGKLVELLNDSADFYQQQLDEITQQLAHLLEPILLIVLGLLIGCVVIAMYLPLFNIGLVVG